MSSDANLDCTLAVENNHELKSNMSIPSRYGFSLGCTLLTVVAVRGVDFTDFCAAVDDDRRRLVCCLLTVADDVEAVLPSLSAEDLILLAVVVEYGSDSDKKQQTQYVNVSE